MNTEDRTHTRWSLPQRSATDRKLGGVAGGLGRALQVDPLLLRVAFVVLALFGGSGVLLYCAGWLLMRGDDDEVSAIEALAGRGRSSVSPMFAVVLIVIGLGSMGSVFSWGIPFWPVLIGAIILVVVLSRRRNPNRPWHPDAAQWADDFATRAAQWGQEFGERAERWGQSFTGGSSSAGAGPASAGPASADLASSAEPGPTAEAAPASAPAETAGPPEPEDLLHDGRTPPAWDPLGAAPFAWDLPEPAAPEPPDAFGAATPRHRGPKPGSVTARIFLGLALIVASLTAIAVATGAVHLAWSVVAGITLGVLAVGMLIAALQGRGGRLLLGPGVFVAVLTLGLTVTGMTGTTGIGDHRWSPATAADVQSRYFWNAGDATLDLSGISVPAGETVGAELTVAAGRATVILPDNVTVRAQCSATAGAIDCMGIRDRGVRPLTTVDHPGDGGAGTLDITVHSNTGQAVLISHE